MTWQEDAVCRDADNPYLWETANSHRLTTANMEAIEVCSGCPVRTACLADALAFEQGAANRWHIWGGLTPPQRAQLDKGPRRPKQKVRVA